MDAKCDQYAAITRKVTESSGTELVDLRRVFLAYFQNHTAELRVDGSLNFLSTDVLTYDRVHPNSNSKALLAEHINRVIHDALNKLEDR